MSLRLPRFSPPSVHRAPRPPKDAPPAPKIQHTEGIRQSDLRDWTDPPPQFPGSDLEWIVWEQLVRLGFKIYGRPNVKGRTLNYAEADAEYQPAIPVRGLNQVKDFFRADFLLIPGRKAPAPGPPFSRGVVLDPVTLFTHGNTGLDRLRRGMLAQAGYLLVWLDGDALKQRPKEVVTNAVYGRDDSAIDRGAR